MTTKDFVTIFVVTGIAILLVGLYFDNNFVIGYATAKLISALYLLLLGEKWNSH